MVLANFEKIFFKIYICPQYISCHLNLLSTTCVNTFELISARAYFKKNTILQCMYIYIYKNIKMDIKVHKKIFLYQAVYFPQV